MTMPPIVNIVLSLISAVAASGPQLAQFYKDVRTLFEMWFKGGVITVEQQALLRQWADDHEAATLAGEVPPEWVVRPDPT